MKSRDHAAGILQELYWLPCEARTYFKILCYFFKCLHSLAPTYPSDLLTVKEPHERTWCIPKTLPKYGDKSFACSEPRLLNSLPREIRLVNSLDSFKSKLKNYLFSSS